MYGSLGRIDPAIHHARMALEICLRIGTAHPLPLAQSGLAGLLLERGELAEAEPLIKEALAGTELRSREHLPLPECYGLLARLRAATGDAASAERAARTALAIAEARALSIDEGVAARILGALCARAGCLAEAEGLLERSERRLDRVDRHERARTPAARARLADAQGRPGRAREWREAARRVLRELDAARDLARLDDPDDLR